MLVQTGHVTSAVDWSGMSEPEVFVFLFALDSRPDKGAGLAFGQPDPDRGQEGRAGALSVSSVAGQSADLRDHVAGHRHRRGVAGVSGVPDVPDLGGPTRGHLSRPNNGAIQTGLSRLIFTYP